MEKDYITERLKFLIEFFKLCWLSIFAVGGGMVSMFVVQGNPYRYPLVSAGGIVMLALLCPALAQSSQDATAVGRVAERRRTMILDYLPHALMIVAVIAFLVVAWKIVDNT